jgi:hypothetical protein
MQNNKSSTFIGWFPAKNLEFTMMIYINNLKKNSDQINIGTEKLFGEIVNKIE